MTSARGLPDEGGPFPYYAKTRTELLSSPPVAVIEQAAKADSTSDLSIAIGEAGIGHDEHVADALVISFAVIMSENSRTAVRSVSSPKSAKIKNLVDGPVHLGSPGNVVLNYLSVRNMLIIKIPAKLSPVASTLRLFRGRDIRHLADQTLLQLMRLFPNGPVAW